MSVAHGVPHGDGAQVVARDHVSRRGADGGRSPRGGSIAGAGGRPGRGRVIAAAVVLAVVALAAVLLLPPLIAAAAIASVAVIVLLRRFIFTWTAMIISLAAVIMLVPARRYAIPIPLPFQLEPYRLVLGIVIIALVVSLILKPEVRWRPVAFGWPIGIFLATIAVSFVVNVTDLANEALIGTAVGGMVQMGFMLAVFFAFRLLLRSERDAMLLITFITWAGVVVAFFAVVERMSRFNVFLVLGNFLPLTLLREGGDVSRAGVARAFGSAQHPIALAVALCILIPLAVYLAKYAAWPHNEINRRIVYGAATVLLFGGIMAAISRTAVVVLAVMFLVTLILHPKVAGVLFALALPVMLLAAAVVPKVFESMVLSFLDVDSLVASQYTSAGMGGAGRLADLEPAMAEVEQRPFFGSGFGSRIVIGDDANAFILDNQFLGTLMETGALGVLGLAVLLLVPPIMLLRFAFTQAAERRHALLAFAIAVAISGYIAAIFFYDAFGFFQTFFILCMLLAVGAWLLTEAPRRAVEATGSRADAAASVEATDADAALARPSTGGPSEHSSSASGALAEAAAR
ncbi:O-antigen ligase family protein [Agromyces sp. NPDC058110]|uniref:O-antigen ligase family protein n=1 Tax=Agromyces sp. NPDC058110 TaxID=3346345 RepID=UPI0036DEA833